MTKDVPVRLYHFYNVDKSDYGAPFALCDKHHATQKVPANCFLEKLADAAVVDCVVCDEEKQAAEDGR